MDALDKAQALAKKDSALGTEKLKEAEKLVSDNKVFEQIEAEARKCSASMDELNQAHENARSVAEVVVVRQKEIQSGVENVEKEGLPSVPYKPEIDGIAAQASKAREILTPDPIGRQADPRPGPGARRGTPRSRAPDPRPLRGWTEGLGGTDQAGAGSGRPAARPDCGSMKRG